MPFRRYAVTPAYKVPTLLAQTGRCHIPFNLIPYNCCLYCYYNGYSLLLLFCHTSMILIKLVLYRLRYNIIEGPHWQWLHRQRIPRCKNNIKLIDRKYKNSVNVIQIKVYLSIFCLRFCYNFRVHDTKKTVNSVLLLGQLCSTVFDWSLLNTNT